MENKTKKKLNNDAVQFEGFQTLLSYCRVLGISLTDKNVRCKKCA